MVEPEGCPDVGAEQANEERLAGAGRKGQEKAESEETAMASGEGEVVDKRHALTPVPLQRSQFHSGDLGLIDAVNGGPFA